jgi:NTP pyrophosphatase (non-canonical NTP hydrolase)
MIKQYQQELDEFFKAKGWPYWQPLSMLARLTEEVGEFARLVNHQFGEKKKKAGESEQDFEDEMGDILFVLISFANAHNLDLDKAIRKSLDKVAKRDERRWDKIAK